LVSIACLTTLCHSARSVAFHLSVCRSSLHQSVISSVHSRHGLPFRDLPSITPNTVAFNIRASFIRQMRPKCVLKRTSYKHFSGTERYQIEYGKRLQYFGHVNGVTATNNSREWLSTAEKDRGGRGRGDWNHKRTAAVITIVMYQGYVRGGDGRGDRPGHRPSISWLRPGSLQKTYYYTHTKMTQDRSLRITSEWRATDTTRKLN